MTSKIAAINAYHPRIDLGNTVQNDELVRYIADRTNLNSSMVALVIGHFTTQIPA